MLISCFQCRQQLDVPDDSSGKRVRCPHCQYVIVVPVKARPAEGIQAPTTALPSMELDAETDKPAPTTKLPAQPMPPFDLPPIETGKSEPGTSPPIEELPPVPSIDRSRRRRAPLAPLPPSKAPWGRIVGIGTVIGLIVIGVVVGVFSSRENRRRRHQPPIVFHNNPPMQMEPPVQIPAFPNQGFQPGFQNPNFPHPPPVPGVRIDDGVGLVFQELDTIDNGSRRDDEFTAMALHPQEQIAVTGSVASHLKVAQIGDRLPREGDNFGFPAQGGKAIEQISISQDGRWLAVSVGGNIHYWHDWTRGMPGNKTSVKGSRCAFTKDHRLLVATKDDIKEYQTLPQKVLSTLAVADLTIQGFALSADERTLAVYGEKAITLWQWPDKRPLGRIEAHDAPITNVAFAPDGKTLVSASADRTIKLWHVDTRKEHATLRQHAWTVSSLAFTPDGKHLASGGLDGMLLLWDVEPEKPQLVWSQSHQFPVRAVAFDDGGMHLYLTCKHPAGVGPAGSHQYSRQLRKIALADIKQDAREAERLVAQQAGLHLPATSTMSYFSPYGNTFVTTTDGIDRFSVSNSLRIWDTATATLRHAHGMNYRGVLSPDGKWFVFAKFGAVNQMQLLDMQTNQVTDTVMRYAGDFPQVMFTSDSKSLWVRRIDAQHDDFVRYEMVRPKDGRPVLVAQKPLKLKEPNDPRTVRISQSLDYKTFLVERISFDGVMHTRTRTLYTSSDGKELPLPKSAPGQWSPYLFLRRVVESQLELHDFLSGNTQTIGQQREAIGVSAIHPKRKLAATTETANNQTLRTNLWDLQERRPLLTLPEVRARTISAIRFSPDGRYLALVSGDSWTRIVPIDWLMEREKLLQCPPNDVAGP
jgi:WD40 repeat protein/DNA-directed RNA polymerase subunit RPC12/RpoP